MNAKTKPSILELFGLAWLPPRVKIDSTADMSALFSADSEAALDLPIKIREEEPLDTAPVHHNHEPTYNRTWNDASWQESMRKWAI